MFSVLEKCIGTLLIVGCNTNSKEIPMRKKNATKIDVPSIEKTLKSMMGDQQIEEMARETGLSDVMASTALSDNASLKG